MEVSTINSSSSPAVNKNTGQLLANNDNMQSHEQKSQVILINNSINNANNNVNANNSISNCNNGNNLTTKLRQDDTISSHERGRTETVANESATMIVTNQISSSDSLETRNSIILTVNDNQLKLDVNWIIEKLLSQLGTKETVASEAIKFSSNDNKINNAEDDNDVIDEEDDSEPIAPNEERQSQTDSQTQILSDITTASESDTTKTSILTQVLDDYDEDVKSKDIVTLRNLEITPPPQPTIIADEDMAVDDHQTQDAKETTSRKGKRKRTDSIEQTNQSSTIDTSEGRSKRQRTQTKLFQVGESAKVSTRHSSSTIFYTEKAATGRRRSSTASTKSSKKNDGVSLAAPKTTTATDNKQLPSIGQDAQHQNVIYYEKNDYLAVRNLDDLFYLCQLSENVRVNKESIKVKWLDTKDGGKTYFLTSQYDMVPQRSIIMPVILNKLKSEKKGEQLFSLDDQDKDNIMERLKRSINSKAESEQAIQ